MPVITLSDASDEKLVLLITKPFEDTRESLIADLIDAEVSRRGVYPDNNGVISLAKGQVLQLEPDSHENLTHTRLISAMVDGRPIHKPNWAKLLENVHMIARKRLNSFEELDRISSTNLRQGRYEEEGYKYLEDMDFSIQGVDSNAAWDRSLEIAREIGVSIEVKVEWRQKQGAARPGQAAILSWVPKTS